MSLPLNQSAGQIQYASSVASQLAQVWLWDPGFALSTDPEAPEKQLRDIVISGALDHLQRSIVGHSYTFEPEEDTKRGRDMSKVVELLTKQQRWLPQAWYNLARGTHRGCSWGRIYPERRVLTIFDGKPREWTVVARVRDVDKRRFRLVQSYTVGPQASTAHDSPADILRRMALTQSASAGIQLSSQLQESVAETRNLNDPRATFDAGVLGNFRWEFYRGFGPDSPGGFWWSALEEAAPLDHWIQHVPDTTEWGMGYGYALADELQAYFWLKGQFLKWGAQGVERWGQGFLVAKTKALRDQFAAKGMSQAAALQATVNVIRSWRSENFAAVDELTDIQLLDMPSTAEASVREWIKYLDDAMTRRILSALRPTGGGEGGTYSGNKVEEGSSDSMVAYLRSPLEETWTQTVVRFLVEHNEQNLRELGLWGEGLPRLMLKGKEQRDQKTMIEVFRLARELRVPVKLDDFYEVFGLARPNEEDEAIDYPEVPVPGDPLADTGGFGERLPVGDGDRAVGDRVAA